MANRLKMAKTLCILELHRLGWSARRIARELGVHRETVAAHVRRAEAARAKPATAPIGSEPCAAGTCAPPDESNPAIPVEARTGAGGRDGRGVEPALGSDGPPSPPEGLGRGLSAAGPGGGEGEQTTASAGRFSRCWPHRELIGSMLERGLTAVRIHADLRADHGIELSYHSVRRFVAALGAVRPEPFRRMECAPGEEAQVDFGSGPTIEIDGRRRRTHVLRVVLSHSRKGYAEAVLRQDAESFIRALENAFRHFGGVPRTVVTDNLKAAVLKADWFDPELNPKLVAFAAHHGTTILPTRPWTPRHKGKVERGVGYVKSNALRGRTFGSLERLNAHLLEWERTVADTRVHGTTRRQVGAHFESVERAALLPLPAGRFPCFSEARRKVHRDAHVEVARAYYSVPPEHVGREVWARWDGRVVRLYDLRMTQIAVHARQEPGRFRTDDRHVSSRRISDVERGAASMIRRAGLIGPHAERWAATVIDRRGVEGIRTVAGLRSLTSRWRADRIDRACRIAHGHGLVRLRDVRTLIVRGVADGNEQMEMELVADDPIIRGIDEYQRLAGAAFRRPTCAASAATS